VAVQIKDETIKKFPEKSSFNAHFKTHFTVQNEMKSRSIFGRSKPPFINPGFHSPFHFSPLSFSKKHIRV